MRVPPPRPPALRSARGIFVQMIGVFHGMNPIFYKNKYLFSHPCKNARTEVRASIFVRPARSSSAASRSERIRAASARRKRLAVSPAGHDPKHVGFHPSAPAKRCAATIRDGNRWRRGRAGSRPSGPSEPVRAPSSRRSSAEPRRCSGCPPSLRSRRAGSLHRPSCRWRWLSWQRRSCGSSSRRWRGCNRSGCLRRSYSRPERRQRQPWPRRRQPWRTWRPRRCCRQPGWPSRGCCSPRS